MRTNVISVLFLVFALCLGACGARQAHVGMPSAASLQASAASRETVVQAEPAVSEPAPVAADPVVDVTPTPPAPTVTIGDRRSFQARIDADVRRMLDENDAWMRAEMEKIHQPHLTPTPPDNDELVAALRIDIDALRQREAAATREFYAALDDIFQRVYALEREQGQERAIARAESRRASVAAVTGAQPEIVLAASAASEPAPVTMPKDAATVASKDMKTEKVSEPQPMTLFTPDPSTVAKSGEVWTLDLIGAAVAAVIGILFGLYLARRKSREFREEMQDAYRDVPDGTLLVQEIQGGSVHRTFMVMTKIQLRKSGLDAESVRDLEQQWFDQPSSDAATVANDESPTEPLPVPEPTPAPHAVAPPPSITVMPVPVAPPASAQPSAPPIPNDEEPPPLPPPPARGNNLASVAGEIIVIPKDDALQDAASPDPATQN